MKKVLILVLSCELKPYDKMYKTGLDTWDRVSVPGSEVLYYFGSSKKTDSDNCIYLPYQESLLNMGYKTIDALEYTINNREFDYIARVHSSIYVNKDELIKYVQTLPDTNVFAGSVAKSQNGFEYLWGGTGFIISRDVVKKMVDNKLQWQHKYMEDESISLLANWLSIPFTDGYAGAIDNMTDHWRCISYGGESITFTDFADLKKLNHHFYRVKQDGQRWVDELIMRELIKVL